MRRIEEHKGLVVAPALVIKVGDARPLDAVKLALRLLAATPPIPPGRTRLHANALTWEHLVRVRVRVRVRLRLRLRLRVGMRVRVRLRVRVRARVRVAEHAVQHEDLLLLHRRDQRAVALVW